MDSLWSRASSRLSSWAESQRARLWLVAAASSGLTVAAVFAGQSARRRNRRRQLRDDIRRRERRRKAGDEGDGEEEVVLDEHGMPVVVTPRQKRFEEQEARHTGSSKANEALIAEQLTRNMAFLGEEGMGKVRQAFVVVVGLGGVGSTAAVSLARSGVGRIRLIDFDQVTLSSLNRHATATRADVGMPKVHSCRDFVRDVAPWIVVESMVDQFTLEAAPRLLAGAPDWVLDCIDNIDTKVELLKYCKDNAIPIMSALGAASKADPSRIQLADISETMDDPLARSVRRRLRLHGVSHGIPVVYSTEVPGENVRLLPLPEEEFQKGKVEELAALQNFRVRILPVLGPVPAMFGQALAAHVLTSLAGFPTKPLPVKDRSKIYHKLFNDLATRELRLTGIHSIPLNVADVGYLFEDLHRGRSVVAPTFADSSKPALLRWRADEPLSWENAVVMTREEAARHEQEVLVGGQDPEEVWGEETAELVARRVREERAIRYWR